MTLLSFQTDCYKNSDAIKPFITDLFFVNISLFLECLPLHQFNILYLNL